MQCRGGSLGLKPMLIGRKVGDVTSPRRGSNEFRILRENGLREGCDTRAARRDGEWSCRATATPKRA